MPSSEFHPPARRSPPRYAVTPADYRTTLGLFTTGVTVVATWDGERDRARGMTANAFMAVSLEPPLVVVSVRRQAHLHQLVTASGRYSVNLLTERAIGEARRFAGMPVDAQQPASVFEERCGVPFLLGSLAWIAATVVDCHRAGDHTLFVGEVTALARSEPERLPLAFFSSTFARVTPLPRQEPFASAVWDQAVESWG